MLQAPYGKWESPISANQVAESQKKIGNICLEDSFIYWDEMRPYEKGRSVVMRSSFKGEIQEMTPFNVNVGSRVHEYGGGCFTVDKGRVYYVNNQDQRVYIHDQEIPLTPEHIRCADLHVVWPYLICVAEEGNHHFIVSVHIPTLKWKKIAESKDFYSSICFNAKRNKIAFLSWNHPQMPWDGTDLWLGDFIQGEIASLTHIAGGKDESIFQPSFAPSYFLHNGEPDEGLYFVSDQTNWWNLYRFENGKTVNLYPMNVDCGLPNWVFRMSTYAFTKEFIVLIFSQNGKWFLKELKTLDNLMVSWSWFSQIRANENSLVCITASESLTRRVIQLDLKTNQEKIITQSADLSVDSRYYSQPRFLVYPSYASQEDAKEHECYAYYYPPFNPDFNPLPSSLPPLLVMLHGGPTASTVPILDLKIQYWTSRGFAVLDIDYSGSSGYGRLYRNRLKGQWGIVDVADCKSGAQYLIKKKMVDSKKIAIRGGSAGGFTTLVSLMAPSVFTAGASYYGISDLELLAKETHSFESHYLDSLIGSYPAQSEIYRERSPIYSAEHLLNPIIFFQGKEDRVVPFSQAENLYHVLKNQGILTDLIIYPEEQHGFKNSKNISDALNREYLFYLKAWNN